MTKRLNAVLHETKTHESYAETKTHKAKTHKAQVRIFSL